MNKSFRTIWNETRGCFVVTHEKAATGGKPSSTRTVVAQAVTAALLVIGAGQAAGQVVPSTCLGTGALQTVSTAQTEQCDLENGDSLTVSGLGSIAVASSGTAIYAGSATIGSITNSGSIAGGFRVVSLVESALTGSFVNDGTISGGRAINLDDTTVAGDLINAGHLVVTSAGIYIDSDSLVSGTIRNSSTITAGVGDQGMDIDGQVNSGIQNSGLISVIAQTNISQPKGTGIRIEGVVRDGVTNSGIISATNGIYVEGRVFGGLTNTGTITNPGTMAGAGVYIEDGLVDGTLALTSPTDVDNRGWIHMRSVGDSSTINGNYHQEFATNDDPAELGFGILNTSSGSYHQLTVSGTATFTGADSYLVAIAVPGASILNGDTLTGVLNAGSIAGTLAVTDTFARLNFTATTVGGRVDLVAATNNAYCGETVNGSVTGPCEVANDSRTLTVSGTISGGASGIDVLRYADADRILISSTGSVSGSNIGIFVQSFATLSGGITNSGTIDGNLTLDYGNSVAQIINSGTLSLIDGDIRIDTSMISGAILNEGTITGEIDVDGSGVGSLNNQGTINGMIDVSDSQIGTIVNQGRIGERVEITDSTLTSLTNGNGAVINGSSVALKLDDSTLTGGLTNSGSIVAAASSSSAIGLSIQSVRLTGGLINNGMIAGLVGSWGTGTGLNINESTLTGGITNIGTIIGSGGASSDGIGLSIRNTSLTGGITNSGTISGTGGNSASGIGVYLNDTTLTGGLINSGTISGANVSLSGSTYAIKVEGSSSLDGITIAGDNTARFIGAVYAPDVEMSIAAGATYTLRGDDSFTVSGFTNNGTARFNGNHNFDLTNVTGNTFVNNGTLAVTAGNTGTITGNFTNTGTFSPVVSSDTSYGKLLVSGTAALGGVLYADAASVVQGALTDGGTLAGVITAGTLTGTFGPGAGGQYDSSTFYDLTPVYNTLSGTMDLTIALASSGGVPIDDPVSSAVASTGNTPATGAANVLDGIITSDIPTVTVPGGPQMTDVIAALDNLATTGGDRAVSDALNQTLPLLTGSNTVAASAALSGINRVVQARQDANRGLSSGEAFYGDQKLWMKPFGSKVDQSDRKGVSGYDANVAGIAFGSDATVSDKSRVGLAFAYAKANIDGNSRVAPNEADVAVYQLIGYGSYALDSETEINYQLGFGQNKNEGKRQINFVAPAVTAKSDFRSHTATLGVGIGRNFKLSEQLSFTPSVRGDYVWIKDKAYTESGAGALNLDVKRRTTEELIFALDGKLTYQLQPGMALSGNLGVGYDVINERASVTSAYAGAPTAAFTTRGFDPSPWMVRGGLGLSTTMQSGVEIAARYDADYREGFLNQTASVKARWAF